MNGPLVYMRPEELNRKLTLAAFFGFAAGVGAAMLVASFVL